MKPFNLQEALAGKPVVTRDGRKVSRIIHMPEVADPYNKVLAISDARYMTYSESGEFSLYNWSSVHDLFMASEKKEGWIAVYKKKDEEEFPRASNYIYDTEGEAHSRPFGPFLTVAKVTWEE